MSGVTVRSVVRSEWIKFRSVPSTLWCVGSILSATIGLGALITWVIALHYQRFSAAAHLTFDPLSTSLAGVFFAQFAIGVLGAMFITSEYTTTSIQATLAAVPRRTTLVVAKLVVMALSLLLVGEAAVFFSFPIGQAVLATYGAPSFSLAGRGVAHALVFAGIYLTLLGALGFGLGLLLRKTPAAIVTFVLALLIVPILVQVLPASWSGPIDRYLPNELGVGMMSLNQAPGHDSPLECLLILLGYVIALLAVGTYLFNRRDAGP